MAAAQPPKAANPNQTVMLVGLMLAVFSIASIYQYMAPRLKTARTELEARRAIGKGLEQDVSALNNIQTRLTAAKDQMESRNIDTDFASQVIPPTEEVPSLYIQMEQLMTGTPGISGTTYQISPPVADQTNQMVKIPITASATGRYTDLKKFIVSLETNVRPITLTTMSFAQANTKSSSPDQMTVTLAGYVRAQSLSKQYSSSSATK